MDAIDIYGDEWVAEHLNEFVTVWHGLPDLLPRNSKSGKKVSSQYCLRKAVKGPAEDRIPTRRIGAALYTHRLWIADWLRRRSSPAGPNPTPTKTKRRADNAMAELAAIGAG